MKNPLVLSLILIILGGGILFFWPSSQSELLEVETASLEVAELAEKEISTPLPLRATEELETEATPLEVTEFVEVAEELELLEVEVIPPEVVEPVILSQQGVIEWTNTQREKYGLPVFRENPKLNAMAQSKAEDMLQNQYFAHESPLGEGAGDLAKVFAYEFLAIGENLAMGNFQNDESLVEAWMASPGHRENILSPTYREIGVAVQKGIFNGNSVWLAVQHFGLPLSACSQPSEVIRLQIEQNQQELAELRGLLVKLRAELRIIRPRWGDNYQQKLEEYNILVEKYNNLLTENEILINQYNEQVQQFNQCVAGLK